MRIRTFAVGLIISVILIMELSISFFKWVLSASPAFAFQQGLRTLTETAANTVGVGVVIPAAYIIFCLGLGFAISGIFYPVFEGLFLLGVRKVIDFTYELVQVTSGRRKAFLKR